MAFTKGNKEGQGRPKGAKNKTTMMGREMLEKYFYQDNGLQRLLKDIQTLEYDRDRVNATIKLLEYILPKQKELSIPQFEDLKFKIVEDANSSSNDKTE